MSVDAAFHHQAYKIQMIDYTLMLEAQFFNEKLIIAKNGK